MCIFGNLSEAIDTARMENCNCKIHFGVMPQELLEVIKKNKDQPKKDQSFIDMFFDIPCKFKLSLRNMWLRYRYTNNMEDGKWCFRICMTDADRKAPLLTFFEYTSPQDICLQLIHTFGFDDFPVIKEDFELLTHVLRGKNLSVMKTISTRRIFVDDVEYASKPFHVDCSYVGDNNGASQFTFIGCVQCPADQLQDIRLKDKVDNLNTPVRSKIIQALFLSHGPVYEKLIAKGFVLHDYPQNGHIINVSEGDHTYKEITYMLE